MCGNNAEANPKPVILRRTDHRCAVALDKEVRRLTAMRSHVNWPLAEFTPTCRGSEWHAGDFFSSLLVSCLWSSSTKFAATSRC